jgi:tRNA A58 N-methylase Trm61
MVKGGSAQSQYGEFYFDELIGHPYGQRFFSSKGLTGWVYPLRASPEILSSGGLAHRTQLVHSSDVSYITFAMRLRAGHVVVEAGKKKKKRLSKKTRRVSQPASD